MLITTERAQPDLTRPFILTTDASDKAIGAIISHKNKNRQETMISTFNKTLDKAQQNYGITDKESLAVVKAIEHYRHYLIGKKFILYTDHKALTYLWEAKNPTTRMIRWVMKLQEYDFEVIYIKGEENRADELSRPRDCTQVKITDTDQIMDENIKKEILKEYHLISGHGTANNMKYLMGEKYKWNGMFKEIDDLVRKCEICQKSGLAIPNNKNRIIKTEGPNKLWECDLIGPLPRTFKNNRFILVCTDHFTKWVEAIPVKTKDAITISNAIEETVIKKYGIPRRILSDYDL